MTDEQCTVPWLGHNTVGIVVRETGLRSSGHCVKVCVKTKSK